MPAVGYRELVAGDGGSLYSQGFVGVYWSFTQADNLQGRDLWFSSGDNRPGFANVKSQGMSIRCVRKSTFFLPAIGGRDPGDGALYGPRVLGHYWSSTLAHVTLGVRLHFTSTGSDSAAGTGPVGTGYNIRCVRLKSNERGEIRVFLASSRRPQLA